MGRKFLIRTDHTALFWLLQWKDSDTSQYCHWRNDLENFDMEVEHRAGEKHFLSRLKCQQCQLNHEDPKLKRNVKQFEPDEITFRRIQALSLIHI